MENLYILGGTILFLCLIVAIFWLRLRKINEVKQALESVVLQVKVPKVEGESGKQKENIKDFKDVISRFEQVLNALSSTRIGFLKAFFKPQPRISFEFTAKDNAISVFVTTPRNLRSRTEKVLSAQYPDANIQEVTSTNLFSEKTCQAGCLLVQSKPYEYPIKTYDTFDSDPINNILGALTKLAPGEGAAIQIIIHSADKSWRKYVREKAKQKFKGDKKKASLLKALISGPERDSQPGKLTPAEEEMVKAMEAKASKPGFETTIRLIVSADTEAGAEIQLDNIISTFDQVRLTEGNMLKTIKQKPAGISRDYLLCLEAPKKYRSVLNSTELSTLFHLPHYSFNPVPNFTWQNYRIEAPPGNVPKEGLLLGVNQYRGIETPICMKDADRFRHFYIIGQTGTGKSTVLRNMIRQDIENGKGVAVIDPHGDLAEHALEYVPKERADDVVYFNPSDTARPMGLNMFEAKNTKEAERLAQDSLLIMIKLFGEEVFSPRLQDYFRNGALTLMSDPDNLGTLTDIVRLFTDEPYQKFCISKVTNPVVKDWWVNTFGSMGSREKQEMIPYFAAKFGAFITNGTMRNIIGQAKSGFDFKDIMDNKKILLVNLSKGQIGELNANLLGMIIVTKLQVAAMQRAEIPEDERIPFYLYIDEFQNVVTDAIESILSEARKYKFSLNIAHQYIGQLEKFDGIKKAVFGNVGTKMCYTISAEDAEFMAKEFSPTFSEQDLVNLDARTGVLKLSIDIQPSRPFSIRGVAPKEGDKNIANAIKQLSRLKYARDVKFVEREINARLGTL